MNKQYSKSSLDKSAERLAFTMNPKLAGAGADAELKQDLADIVNRHALGAAAAGLGIAWLPGAGATAAMAAMVGFIWTMYFRINGRIGLKISKVLLKSLASAVLSNLAQAALAIVGSTALATVLSLTGVGAAASSVIMAAVDYAVVLVGGIVYLKLLNGLFAAGRNPGDLNEREMKIAMEKTMAKEDVASLLRNAKKDYASRRKSGEITGRENVTVLPD